MIERWRLLQHGARSAYENMAIDESILRQVAAGDSPYTLRFYRWDPSAVSVGYFQSVDQEIDTTACETQGVDIIRRLTGGGAVYHDRDGEITYSLAIPVAYPGIPRNVLESYDLLCSGLVEGLRSLGLDAEFKPINDIIVNGRKISGNAQTRRFGGILQHGTILVRVDPSLMFSLLKVPSEKIRDKLIASADQRVTSIERELDYVDLAEIETALIDGFAKALNIELVPAPLTDEEVAMANRLREERYATDAWIFKR